MIRFIQVLHDQCLIIVTSRGRSHVFMNIYSDIERAINRGGFRIAFDRDFLGARPMYAYEETTRNLVVCYGKEVSHYIPSLSDEMNTCKITLGTKNYLVHVRRELLELKPQWCSAITQPFWNTHAYASYALCSRTPRGLLH